MRKFSADRMQGVARLESAHSLIESVEGALGDDQFAGSLLRKAYRQASSRVAGIAPMLANAGTLLAPDRGFLSAMCDVFAADLGAHLENLLLIERMCSSAPFISDARYRRNVLHTWCSGVLSSPGFLLVHPSTTLWKAQDDRGRFRLNRRHEDLELCVLLGSLGFAQICDDLLAYPTPLLVAPWSPGGGLLRPRELPGKSFSQNLCVKRIRRRRLLLFDKHRLD